MSEKERKNDILPPLSDKKDDVYVNILAQYTERPDLFLETMEKHDPGFIKKMNENSIEYSSRFRESKFKFGERQAYSALISSLVFGFIPFGLIFYLIAKDQASFWNIVALAVLFAITQGGLSGFKKITEAISDLIKTFKK